MESSGTQQPRSEPEEDTPLLEGSRDATEEEEHPVQNEDSPLQRVNLPRIYRVIAITSGVSVALGVCTAAFMIPAIQLQYVGSSQFGFYSRLDRTLADAGVLWAGTLGILFAVANMARLKQSSRPMPPLLNVLCFGIVALISYAIAVDIAFDHAQVDGYCDDRLGDPDYWYPGTMKQCKSWAIQYQTVIWLTVAFSTLYGITVSVLLVTVLASVYSRRSSDSQNGATSAWTLPVGQVAVEVALRWGPGPQQQTTASTDNGQ